MRTLSETLLAAQRSASAEPYVRVRLFDRDVGAARLRWERVYEGGEGDGPGAAALTSDGSLVHAWVEAATGVLYRRQVAAPAVEGDFSAKLSLGLAAVGPGVGLAASGSRVLLAYVLSSGETVIVRESTDGGATFGTGTTVATPGATVTAVACTLQANGNAAVFYAVEGTVYASSRSGSGGSWSTPAAWSPSLASVNGLAAIFEVDHSVVVSGTTSGGEAGAWSTVLGVGGGVPPDTWLPLTELTAAATNSDVTYRASGLARAGVPRAALVESYTGAGSYDRVQLADGLGGTTYLDQLWREPRPFAHTSPWGLAIAASTAEAWLLAADGAWRAALDLAPVELTDDVVSLDLEQAREGGRLRVVLRDPDGRYAEGAAPLALSPGGELLVEAGYATAAGAETSPGARHWIGAVRRRVERGTSTVELEAVDGWGVLEGWRAPRQLVWAAGSTTADLVLLQILRRAGLRLTQSGASGEAVLVQPAFTVRAGERAATAVRRLLATLPDHLLMAALPVLREPAADDAVTYAYGEGHVVRSLALEAASPRAGWARVFGAGVFAEAVDGGALLEGAAGAAAAVIAVDDNLDAQARADVRASTLLRASALAVPRGELVALPNVGQEVDDVVTVTDAATGLDGAAFRVSALRLRYERGARPRYEMRLSLGEV